MKPLLLIFWISCCFWACQNNTLNTPDSPISNRHTTLEDTAIVYYTNSEDTLSVEYTMSDTLEDFVEELDTTLLAEGLEEPAPKAKITKVKKRKYKRLPKDVDGNPWTLTFPELEARINRENDTLYIYNFWATWCKPCIEELPYFERLTREYADKKIKVVLVSLDFPELLNHKFIPYVKERRLKSKVYLLDAGNPNEWVNKVNPSWSGAIPATLVVHAPSNRRSFYEQSFDYEALVSIVKKSL